MRLITFMASREIETRACCILEKMKTRSSFHVLLLESSKISRRESRSSSEAKRKIRMLISTRKSGHSIKMTLPLLILLVDKLEISLPPANVVRCQLSIFGTPTQWHPLPTSVLDPKLRDALLFLLVLARSTSLPLTRATTISCTSTISTDKRCSCSSRPDLMPSTKFSGLKSPMISSLSL